MRSIACFLARFLAILVLVISAVGLVDGPVMAHQTQIPPEEYAALCESTDCANWESNRTLPTNNPCALYGVSCTAGHVSRLDLSHNRLRGAIPNELRSTHWLVTEVDDELHIAYGSDVDFPQYGLLHLDSGFFRLNYGPASGWGTSVILLPALWSDGVYHQGAPVDATWQVEGAELILTVTGTIASLDVSLTVRLYPPVRNLRILADIEATIEGSAPLDHRPGEAFKPVMLSSMHISATQWDTQAACAAAQSYAIHEDGWIIWPHVVDQTFGLIGGTSEWKVNAPSVLIELAEPMTITGWVTPSEDPNDDNVGFWAASDSVLSSWSYRIYTSSVEKCTDPPAGWDLFLPLVLRTLDQ